jgi:hypothetical protein
MLSLSTIPRKAERTATRVIGGEALIMAIDRRELHRLNAVGTRVLELCDGKNSVDAISQIIVDEFDVEPSVALSDVMHFLNELAAVGVLLVEGAP